MPFNAEKISSLTDDEIGRIDQFIFRFSKLQDALGNKLFKTVLISLGEEVASKSVIDIFNRLEQLEIIENYDIWQELRNLRNELAHDYEDDPAETAEKLNLLVNKKLNLEKYLNDIVGYLLKKGLREKDK